MTLESRGDGEGSCSQRSAGGRCAVALVSVAGLLRCCYLGWWWKRESRFSSTSWVVFLPPTTPGSALRVSSGQWHHVSRVLPLSSRPANAPQTQVVRARLVLPRRRPNSLHDLVPHHRLRHRSTPVVPRRNYRLLVQLRRHRARYRAARHSRRRQGVPSRRRGRLAPPYSSPLSPNLRRFSPSSPIRVVQPFFLPLHPRSQPHLPLSPHVRSRPSLPPPIPSNPFVPFSPAPPPRILLRAS